MKILETEFNSEKTYVYSCLFIVKSALKMLPEQGKINIFSKGIVKGGAGKITFKIREPHR